MATQLYVVEDHEIMREVIVDWISRYTEVEILGSASSAEEALRELPGAGADVVLVDMSLPGMNGIELVAVLHEQMPEVRCVVFSGHSEPDYARQALKAGAEGYILKGDPYEFETAIEKIAVGERFISAELRKAIAPD